ncbi:MAG TPA: hypothetical protein VHK69_01740 [Chitinophagaceae bacterium]|jgi:hypothetical protein|nr:hypothetical protein [Chitinophagaceae bacterium]
MKKHPDHYSIAFHDRARPVEQRLYRDFRHSADRLDRQGEEHVFRQLQGHFCNRLKMELQHIASELMAGTGPEAGRPESYPAFHVYIEDYIHEFTLKIRSL